MGKPVITASWDAKTLAFGGVMLALLVGSKVLADRDQRLARVEKLLKEK